MPALSKLLAKYRYSESCVALYKPNVTQPPTQLAIAYIHDGKGYIGYASTAVPYALSDTVLLGNCKDISVCYDTRWRADADSNYHIYTPDLLIIASVDTSGLLSVRLGENASKINLDTGASKCSVIRGWKHISDASIDQGICVAYIKKGSVYIRTGMLINDKYNWGAAIKLQSYGYATDVNVTRTNDYRISITVSYGKMSKMFLSDRTFPGNTVKNEFIAAQQLAIMTSGYIETISTRDISFIEGIGSLKLSVDMSGEYINLQSYSLFGWNVSTEHISIVTMFDIDSTPEALLSALYISDINGMQILVERIEQVSKNTFKLYTSNMQHAYDEANIKFTSSNDVKDVIGNVVPSFEAKVFLRGYIPVPPTPPEVVSVINVPTEVT